MPPRLGHVPALDGLRGVAILLVLAAHGLDGRWGFFAGGALGVDLFFVLSGFLITTLLLEEWAADGRISISGFYLRRARRLLPALVAVVAAAATVEAATGGRPLVHAAIRLSYIVNFVGVFDPHLIGTGFSHLWSLSVEEQFYIVWPLLLIFLLKRHASPLAALVVGIVFVNLVRLMFVPINNWRLVNYLPFTHGDVIAFGCLAAIVHGRVRIPPPLTVAAIAVAGLMVAWFRETHTYYLIPLPLFAAACCIILLAATEPGRMTRALERPLLTLSGRLSYSLYLWHVPLIAALGAPAGIAAAVPVSWLSYRYVEQPFRRRRSTPVAPSVSPSLKTA